MGQAGRGQYRERFKSTSLRLNGMLNNFFYENMVDLFAALQINCRTGGGLSAKMYMFIVIICYFQTTYDIRNTAGLTTYKRQY